MSNLLAAIPEYNRRFRSGFLMGTMAYIGNSTNYLTPLAPYFESLSHVFELMSVHEMPPNFEDYKRYLAHTACHRSDLTLAACTNIYALMLGVPPSRVNLTMVPTYFGHNPSGGSLTQLRDCYATGLCDHSFSRVFWCLISVFRLGRWAELQLPFNPGKVVTNSRKTNTKLTWMSDHKALYFHKA